MQTVSRIREGTRKEKKPMEAKKLTNTLSYWLMLVKRKRIIPIETNYVMQHWTPIFIIPPSIPQYFLSVLLVLVTPSAWLCDVKRNTFSSTYARSYVYIYMSDQIKNYLSDHWFPIKIDWSWEDIKDEMKCTKKEYSWKCLNLLVVFPFNRIIFYTAQF